MLIYMKTFFKDPNSTEDLLNKEKYKLLFVALTFFITALLFTHVLFAYFNLGNILKYNKLGAIIFINCLSFFIVSIKSYRLAGKINNIDLAVKLDKIKRSFYMNYIFITGIPYLALSFWIFYMQDLKSSILLVFIFLFSVVMLYVDWKKYNNFKLRFLSL